MKLTCFKAYDIRGKLGNELDEGIAYRIGRAYAQFLKPKNVVVGGDIRLSSESLKLSLSDGLRDEGVDVFDIGMCGTEEIYFATSHLSMGGGIVVTASHNPIDYNGMKLVREDSRPISGDTGLDEIKRLAEKNGFTSAKGTKRGSYQKISILDDYVQHLLTYIDMVNLKPLKLVVNAGNGAAGHVIDALEGFLPFEFIKINHDADGRFPNGIPNPLLTENRSQTQKAVIQHGADFGIAWDGDFDRCFIFDENGAFIEGYYIVGLLAQAYLQKNRGERIVHDPRLTWNTIDIVNNAGGQAILSKTGHAFIKERMRQENAIYGGEMSAHHYFRDFFYCDSGMIPWLLISELVSLAEQPLSAMLDMMVYDFPSSGEINCQLDKKKQAIQCVLEHYTAEAKKLDYTDGISVEFEEWRFNLRESNTEPLVRLNVESKRNAEIVNNKTSEILALLDSR